MTIKHHFILMITIIAKAGVVARLIMMSLTAKLRSSRIIVIIIHGRSSSSS